MDVPNPQYLDAMVVASIVSSSAGMLGKKGLQALLDRQNLEGYGIMVVMVFVVGDDDIKWSKCGQLHLVQARLKHAFYNNTD